MDTIKKFYYMDVYDINSKKRGYIKDVTLNFSKAKIESFRICAYKIFQSEYFVKNDDVVCFSSNVVAKEFNKGKMQGFKSIKGIPAQRLTGELIGTLEDVVIDENLNIFGILVSTGIIKKFYRDMIFLKLEDVIVERDKIFFTKKDI